MTDLESLVSTADVIVCCGSGGVGKTTSAAALGMQAAHLGRRCVVVTIDPAKRLDGAGELSPGDGKVSPSYKCEVSCIDWYGNSRPIFTAGRVFALMGTSLVEGEVRAGKVTERGRVDLTRPLS